MDTQPTNWSPERKIVGMAIATVVVALLGVATGFDPFPGFEGAVGIIAGYFLPNKKGE